MSQPRRRRRRRKGGGQPDQSRKQAHQAGNPPEQKQALPKRARRRRGRRRGEARQQSSPKSSEDLVRAEPKERPGNLTAPPDGQTLEQIVGELQSVYGVPPYPQEYRITIKVAEERGDRSENGDESVRVVPAESARTNGDSPRREKAPAAPLMRGRSDGDAQGSGGGRRRRGRRRRRKGGGSGSSPPGS